jgi:hypothetical protein
MNSRKIEKHITKESNIMTTTTKHEITEEQLVALESDYITKDSAAIIANEVRKTQMKVENIVGVPPELMVRATTMLSALCLQYGSCWIYHNCNTNYFDDDYSDAPVEDFCATTCPANKGARDGGCNIRDFFSDCKAAGIKISSERRR